MKDNHTAWEERRLTIRRLVSFSRSHTHRQQAGSSVDLIGPGRKPEHRDAFANQCHHETHTQEHTETCLHTVILCVWTSSEMICAALRFAAQYYQSCQAGRSAAQENVAWVENRHTVRMCVRVCGGECVCACMWRKKCVCVVFRHNEKLLKRVQSVWNLRGWSA